MPEYVEPVDLPISSPYRPPHRPFHYGLDYSDGRTGHPIHAVADGTVIYSAFEPGGLGWTITVLHKPGMKSGYGHMNGPSSLPIGAKVKQGDLLGYVGNTGASTGPHLHLWMGENTTTGSIDPASVLHPYTPPGDEPVTPDEMERLSDMTRDKIAAWLNLGTAKGQKSYVDTFDDLLPSIQTLYNDVQAIKTKLGI